jgi:hypothetical protein
MNMREGKKKRHGIDRSSIDSVLDKQEGKSYPPFTYPMHGKKNNINDERVLKREGDNK